jgi:predicted DNA-binding transcriptional regulator
MTQCFVIPETSTLRIAIATLCGVLVCWAGWIVYDYVTVNPVAELRNLRHEVELLKAQARPLVSGNDYVTINHFQNGEKEE